MHEMGFTTASDSTGSLADYLINTDVGYLFEVIVPVVQPLMNALVKPSTRLSLHNGIVNVVVALVKDHKEKEVQSAISNYCDKEKETLLEQDTHNKRRGKKAEEINKTKQTVMERMQTEKKQVQQEVEQLFDADLSALATDAAAALTDIANAQDEKGIDSVGLNCLYESFTIQRFLDLLYTKGPSMDIPKIGLHTLFVTMCHDANSAFRRLFNIYRLCGDDDGSASFSLALCLSLPLFSTCFRISCVFCFLF